MVDQVHDKLPLCPPRALCLVLFLFLPLLAGCLSNSLTSLQVLPPTGTAVVATGQTSQFQALAGFTKSGHASTTTDVTTQAKWQSSNPAVATIHSGGLATGVSAGTATITASMQGAFGIVTGTSNITVTAGTGGPGGRVLTALTVTPGSQTITATGQTAQLIAIGTYTAAPLTQNLSATATWTSSNVQVANVNSTGLVAGVGIGQTTVTAFATASDGSVISANATITVDTAPSGRILISLSVIPPSQSVSSAGETAQFIAIGTYSAAPLTLDLTNQVTWKSSDVQVGQVNSSGLVTGIGSTTDPTVPGAATITALATASDGSVVPASGTFTELSPVVPSSLPTLTVYEVGNGTGTVTAASISGGVITGPVVINCGSGPTPACIGNFPLGTAVLLTALPATGSKFDGWSANCAPYPPIPPSPKIDKACTITMTNNATVGAIFDPITP